MIPDISNSLSEHDCTKLFEALKADLSWEWDSRFETALALIRDKEKDGVRALLEKHLGASWDSSTIERAPKEVQRVLARLGGIMETQLFFAAIMPQNGVIFCAWWPWGNGQTISLRLGTNPKGFLLPGMPASPEIE